MTIWLGFRLDEERVLVFVLGLNRGGGDGGGFGSTDIVSGCIV